MALVAVELIWLKFLLIDLPIPLSCAPTLLTDNLGAQALYQNPVFHSRIMHIEIDHHLLCDQVVQSALHFDNVLFEIQLTDPLTKALSSPLFLSFKSKLMVIPLPLV